MKIDWNRKYTTIAVYVCIVAAITVAVFFIGANLERLGGFISTFQSIMNPLIVGFIIAYLFNPLMKSFERLLSRLTDKKKPRPSLRRTLALICTYIVYAVVLTIIVALIIPQVVESYRDFISKVEGYISSVESFLRELSVKLPFIDVDRLIKYVEDFLSDYYSLVQNITPYLTAFFAGMAEQLKNAFLGIIISVYFLSSKEKLTARLKKLMYAFIDGKKADGIVSFLRFTDDTFGGFIIGKLLDSLIIFILTFITLAIFRIPYYQLISVIVGVTNIIPFFGPFIGAIPSVLIIFVADPAKAFWFIVIILIIQQIDGNIIGPKILGQTTGLSALGVIVAITVMGGLLGVTGMFIGVPLFALLYVLFDRFVTKRIESKENSSQNASDEKENSSDEN